MFERRVIFLLLATAVGCSALLLRAAQVQLVERGKWEHFVTSELNRSTLVQTTRGRILDVNGVVLAEDEPCIDACVEFAALLDPPPEKWINRKTRQRLRNDPTFRRGDLAAWNREEAKVRADHERLWRVLAEVSEQPIEEIFAKRDEIVADVQGRRDYLTDRRYEAALRQWEQQGRASWWRRWLLGESGDAPERKDFDEAINEELQHHILLRDLPQHAQNRLEKLDAELPGLALLPGMRRVYPQHELAAHVIGRLSQVTREDVDADPETDNRQRRYLPNDLAGREGVEKLAERRLRGTRGREYTVTAPDGSETRDRQEPAAGDDVRTSIDIALQKRVTDAFARVSSPNPNRFHTFEVDGITRAVDYEDKPMLGAAVVLDVSTGEVRALISMPSYDLNDYDAIYNDLLTNKVELPMLNRATQVPREIGSTMKVITGLGGIAEGVLEPNERIHCDGKLHIDGRTYSYGRCWVMSMFGWSGHTAGSTPHPTSDLNYPEALQRSCNVFFETVGHRLGLAGLDKWQRQFGFGAPTGVGLPEHSGRASGDFQSRNPGDDESEAWFNAIGQGQVASTPIQSASAMAAVARDGVWVEPTLLPGEPQERRRIPVSAQSIALAKRGMEDVVHTRAGTGYSNFGRRLEDDGIFVRICGKTGSASSSPLTYRDDAGDLVLVPFAPTNQPGDTEETMTAKTQIASPAPWYHYELDENGNPKPQSHAWYVGFAPARNPKIAFAVLIDYGGSGGKSAGSVAQEIIKACVDLGYLENPPAPVEDPDS